MSLVAGLYFAKRNYLEIKDLRSEITPLIEFAACHVSMLAVRDHAKQSLNYRLGPFLLDPQVKVCVDVEGINFSASKFVESCMELTRAVE